MYGGIVQALCFFAFQIYGLKKELEVSGGAGGNPAAESAAHVTYPVTTPSPLPPPTPATTGGGQFVEVLSPASPSTTTTFMFPSGSSQQFGSQDFGGAETSVAASSASLPV